MNELKQLEAELRKSGYEEEDVIEIVETASSIFKSKKYGLVWEEKEEKVCEDLKKSIPYLEEYQELRILKGGEDAPHHLLIEGDNLEALNLLMVTHKNKVNVCYIDPPYNTGNEFIYNDKIVDENDEWKHSKWLSFMNKRLLLAKKLLADDGIIFISIGDDELAQLKLLCDEIFGERNFVSNITRIAKKGSNQGTFFRPTKDYVLIYAKNKDLIKEFSVEKDIDKSKYTFFDKIGTSKRFYKKGHSLYQASLDSQRGCKNQRYYIEAPDGTLIIPPGKNLPSLKKDGEKIIPLTKDDKVWRWSEKTYQKQKHLLIFSKSKKSPLIDSNGEKTEWNVYEKKYLDEVEGKSTMLPDDVFYNFLNSSATKKLNEMGIDFSFSKPTELIKYLISLTNKRNDLIVLDFFAGSGTTGQAVLELNKEDGGNRQFILCTNNENNICEEVTYPRLNKVINGYSDSKDKEIEGISANLKYYKVKHMN